VNRLGAERVIAIGNGRNDMPMMALAGLRIAVVGRKAPQRNSPGCRCSCTDILDALDLMTNPLRLKATLRD